MSEAAGITVGIAAILTLLSELETTIERVRNANPVENYLSRYGLPGMSSDKLLDLLVYITLIKWVLTTMIIDQTLFLRIMEVEGGMLWYRILAGCRGSLVSLSRLIAFSQRSRGKSLGISSLRQGSSILPYYGHSRLINDIKYCLDFTLSVLITRYAVLKTMLLSLTRIQRDTSITLGCTSAA